MVWSNNKYSSSSYVLFVLVFRTQPRVWQLLARACTNGSNYHNSHGADKFFTCCCCVICWWVLTMSGHNKSPLWSLYLNKLWGHSFLCSYPYLSLAWRRLLITMGQQLLCSKTWEMHISHISSLHSLVLVHLPAWGTVIKWWLQWMRSCSMEEWLRIQNLF